MVKKFRQGKFADQTKEVKEAFYFCMLTLMPCVNNEWQRAEVRLHAKLSDITSVSDEAILYWFLTYFQGQWLQETKEEEEHKATHSDMRPPKRNKRQGKHLSTMHFQWFHDMEKELRAKRAEAITGSEWDEAVAKEALQQNEASAGTIVGQPAATDATAEAEQNTTLEMEDVAASYTVDAFDVW